MSSDIHSFRDLRVWQSGMAIVACVYRVTETFPKSETYGLTGQLRRAAVSVPANLAEGHTREHTREYFQHVSVARASLAEAETHLEIAILLGYVVRSDIADLLADIDRLGRQLTALLDSLGRKLDSSGRNPQPSPAPSPEPPAPS